MGQKYKNKKEQQRMTKDLTNLSIFALSIIGINQIKKQ